MTRRCDELRAEKDRERKAIYYRKNRERVLAKCLANQRAARAANPARYVWDADQAAAAEFGAVMTYEEIGEELGISKARVGQLCNSALRKLRARGAMLMELLDGR